MVQAWAVIAYFLAFSRAWVAQASHEVDISVDLAKTHEVSDKLYGIFFEEINHAGEGGLYAELVQDRSFDALAYTTGLSQSGADSLELTPDILAAAAKPQVRQEIAGEQLPIGSHYTRKRELLRNNSNFINQPVSWHPLSSTKVSLTTTDPISENNRIALNLTAFNAGGGLVNSGYWGIPLNGGWIYHFSVYLKGDSNAKVQVVFKSADNETSYGEAMFEGINNTWHKFSANITSNTTDFKAVVALRLLKPASILVDNLSLFPGGNLRPGWQNPFPFREDLLQHLKDLQPRFLRFPGGCYVEGGDWLKNRFPWKTNLGLNEHRSGHLNDVWGYWSTDGLGLYEYMLLSEELEAEPIYVVNNGISHQESVAPSNIQPFIDETLDAMQFLTGLQNTTWGARRASMGRKEPWKINYLAIGNEDCGRPYYIEDYNAFYSAIKAAYPGITLIANCPMLDAAPTDLWDWHSYDLSWTMFERRHDFDNLDRVTQPPIFISEYAVTADGGWGNLRGAVAEASFMTGLERNSDIVKLASYAPLFVHKDNRIWPTNLIVIDNHRSYKTPSYLVQQLFSQFQGVLSAATLVTTQWGDLHNNLAAASTTCQDAKCQKIAVKVVNFNSYEQPILVTFKGNNIDFEEDSVLHHVSGSHPEAENSFENPENVKLAAEGLKLSGSTLGGVFSFKVTLPPWSANAIELTAKQQPSSFVVASK